MAKFATFDFKGLSPSARKAVNESTITKGKATKDGLHPVTVKIAGVVLGPFPSLQDAHDETKKWLIKKFPKKANDSVDSIAVKYGHQVQNDVSAQVDKSKVLSNCNHAIQYASSILRIVTDYKKTVESKNAFNHSIAKGAERNQKLIMSLLGKLTQFG